MKKQELIKALKHLKVQTGSLACLGCGYEHSCSYKGCAIIRKAIAKLEIPNIQIGDSVYFVFFDNNECRIAEEKVVEVGLNGFFLSQIDSKSEPNEYVLYSKIGTEWFFKKEDAEEKMNQLKQ